MLSAALRGARVVLGDQEGWERPASARAASMRPLLHNSRLKMQCNSQLSEQRLASCHAYSSCDGREIQGNTGKKMWMRREMGRENWIYHMTSYHTEPSRALEYFPPSCCCCCCCCRCGCCCSKLEWHARHNLAVLGR